VGLRQLPAADLPHEYGRGPHHLRIPRRPHRGLLWIGISAFAVLVGAAVNAAIDRVWPSVSTAAARAANDRLRAAQAAELVARVEALSGEPDDGDYGPDPDMPSEFPERWSRFLPPDDLKSRFHSGRDREQKP